MFKLKSVKTVNASGKVLEMGKMRLAGGPL
jgi:hypothetical protein